MRRIFTVLLCLSLCCPALAAAEPPPTLAPIVLTTPTPIPEAVVPPTAQVQPDGATGMIFLPTGYWFRDGDEWRFVTQSVTMLNESQLLTAADFALVVTDGALPVGTALTLDQLKALYPGAESIFDPPASASAAPTPVSDSGLTMFDLTGTWFYGEDDQLYYRHEKNGQVMTETEVFDAIAGRPRETPASKKIVYLTIDDTPSIYTMETLAVLRQLKIKATFFVVGAYARQRPLYLRAIYEQGHAIANHSYSHDATILSSSFKSCLNDFRRCEEAVAEALGFPLPMPILRIPYGGSTIPVSFRTQLQENGYLWIDWNSLNGDTEDDIRSDQAALNRAFTTAARYDGSIVILVHDGKKRTIRTLPAMVEHFENLGYEFRVLDTNIERIPGVRMGFPTGK